MISRCNKGSPCLTHELWENLNKTIHNYLSSITLQHIIDRKSAGHTQVVGFTHTHIH